MSESEMTPEQAIDIVARHALARWADENAAKLPSDWLTKWGSFRSHTEWSGWPERDRKSVAREESK